MGGRPGLNGCRKDLCLFCVGLTPEWDQQMDFSTPRRIFYPPGPCENVTGPQKALSLQVWTGWLEVPWPETVSWNHPNVIPTWLCRGCDPSSLPMFPTESPLSPLIPPPCLHPCLSQTWALRAWMSCSKAQCRRCRASAALRSRPVPSGSCCCLCCTRARAWRAPCRKRCSSCAAAST